MSQKLIKWLNNTVRSLGKDFNRRHIAVYAILNLKETKKLSAMRSLIALAILRIKILSNVTHVS